MLTDTVPLLAAAAQQTAANSQIDISAVLSCLKDVTVTLASIAGVIIAYLGLATWRRQLKGKAEYELARRLLKAAFNVRDALTSVRNDLMAPSEVHTALTAAGHSEEEIEKNQEELDVNSAVYSARWRRVSESLSDLDVGQLEAEVLWGRVATENLQPLYDCIRELRVALVRYLRQSRGERHMLSSEEAEKVENVVFEQSDDPGEDQFTAKLRDALSQIEEFVKPKLRT